MEESSEETMVLSAWYVAAWAKEVQDTPVGRRLLGTAVVMFRGVDGTAAALEDRCCHRGLPLSLGRVLGNQLQCGYHGLCFDDQGACVRVPGQERIPSGARVRSFPLVERDALLWIWMGAPTEADPSNIPAFPRHVDPQWLWRGEHFHYRANHHLLYDNLLDLSHVGYVHPFTIGGNEEEHSAAEMIVDRSVGGEVKGIRWMRNTTAPQAYLALKNFKGRIDRCQVMTFRPGLVTISILAKDAGTLRSDDDLQDAYESHGFHGVTPETSGTCHYFWSVGIPAATQRPGLLDKKIDLTRITFEEDRAILEAQYARQREGPHSRFVDIRSDALGNAARRIWAELARRAPSASNGM